MSTRSDRLYEGDSESAIVPTDKLSRKGDHLCKDYCKEALAPTPKFSRRSDRLCEVDCESAIAPTNELSRKGDRLYKGDSKSAILTASTPLVVVTSLVLHQNLKFRQPPLLILNSRRSNTLNKLTLTDEEQYHHWNCRYSHRRHHQGPIIRKLLLKLSQRQLHRS